MTHKFAFRVTVEVERESGKFATREEIADELMLWLQDADQQSISGIGADGESEYVTVSWDVDEEDVKK